MKSPSPENRCNLWGVPALPIAQMLCPLRLAATLLLLLAWQPSHAAMGDLDTSFAFSGSNFRTFAGTSFEYGDSAVQPDGQIVAVGTCTLPDLVNSALTRKNFCAQRFQVGGAPDQTFGTNGVWYDRDFSTTGIFRTFDSVASSVLILSDGKILIGGTCRSNQACMVRLTNAGVRDIPFMRETTYAAVPASPTTRLAETASGNYLIQYSRMATSNDRQLATVANFTPGGVPNILFGTNGVFLDIFSSPNAGYAPKGIITRGDAMWLGGEVANASGLSLRLQIVTAWGVTDQSSGINSTVTKYLGPSAQAAVLSVGAISIDETYSRLAATVVSNGKLGVYRMDDTGYADDAWVVGGLQTTALDARAAAPACQYTGGIALPFGGYVFTGSQFTSNSSGEGTISFCFSQVDPLLNSLVADSVHSLPFTLSLTQDIVRPTLGRAGSMLVAGACGRNVGGACMQRYDILPKNCYDMDGDGSTTPGVDGVILARLLAGFTGNNLLYGVALPSGATRNTAALIQSHFNSCGASPAPRYASCYRVAGSIYATARGLLNDGLAVMRMQQGLRGEALRLGDGRYPAQNFMGYACGFRDLLR